jgi:hypothetical protein
LVELGYEGVVDCSKYGALGTRLQTDVEDKTKLSHQSKMNELQP